MFGIYKEAEYSLTRVLDHRYFFPKKYYNGSCSIVFPKKKFRSLITGPSSRPPTMYENYRRYQRYSVSAKALLTRRDTGSPERLTTQVITISQGGMGFYASAPLAKTTPVSIELMIGNPGMGILDGKIASISSQGDNYFIGIAFDREIPYERFVEIVG